MKNLIDNLFYYRALAHFGENFTEIFCSTNHPKPSEEELSKAFAEQVLNSNQYEVHKGTSVFFTEIEPIDEEDFVAGIHSLDDLEDMLDSFINK